MIELKDILYNVKDGDDYQTIFAVDELTLKENEMILVEGKTGAGKSSFLHLIAGIIRPTSGDILINGKSVVKLPELILNRLRRKNIGILFQAFHLIEELTVIDNILVALVPDQLTLTEGMKAAQQVLSIVGLSSKKNQLARHLSGGEKQKCALARLLVLNPSLILLDEPTAHLDLKATEELVYLLKSLNDKTFLIVSHDKAFKDMLNFDRVLHIDQGRILS